jgi:hypothetical protein
MPYIQIGRRKELAFTDTPHPRTAGELNYILTKVVHKYVAEKGESYQAYNDVLGALEGAKLELYRRRIALYEEIKILENGDVD